jgi:hypothetical protein
MKNKISSDLCSLCKKQIKGPATACSSARLVGKWTPNFRPIAKLCRDCKDFIHGDLFSTDKNLFATAKGKK